jgi:hypothetical protein
MDGAAAPGAVALPISGYPPFCHKGLVASTLHFPTFQSWSDPK